MQAGHDWSVRPLAAVLGRERRLLEGLRGQLRVAAVLAASGRCDRVGPAIRACDEFLDRLGAQELARSLEVVDVAERLGLAGEIRLDLLSDVSPAITRRVLHRHGWHLRRLVYEVQSLADTVTGHVQGEIERSAGELTLDALIHEGTLAVMDRVPPPSLTEFVLGEPVGPRR